MADIILQIENSSAFEKLEDFFSLNSSDYFAIIRKNNLGVIVDVSFKQSLVEKTTQPIINEVVADFEKSLKIKFKFFITSLFNPEFKKEETIKELKKSLEKSAREVSLDFLKKDLLKKLYNLDDSLVNIKII